MISNLIQQDIWDMVWADIIDPQEDCIKESASDAIWNIGIKQVWVSVSPTRDSMFNSTLSFVTNYVTETNKHV